MVKVVLGVLSRAVDLVPPAKSASAQDSSDIVRPVSPSRSLAFTPEPLTSMPSAPLSWIELPRIAFPASAVRAISTPALALWAM
jgi:hypothetical protein